jgi:hypothetical protein
MKSTGQLWFMLPFGYSFTMDFKTIPLEEIDIEDETYRISEELDSVSVLNSLKEIGQLNPVLLLDQTPLKIIVCGFRRIRALRGLNKGGVLARILSKESHSMFRRFELSLWDNLSHRQLNPLEKARLLYKLMNVCGVPGDVLIETYLPLLDLAPHKSVLESYIKLNGIHPALRLCLAEDQLTLSSMDTLAATPYEVQGSMASLMNRIRLSASLQRKILALLEELSAMAGGQMDAPLDDPIVQSILDDSRLSPFHKGEKLHEILYRMKYPRLSKALDRFQASRKQLALPGSIRIIPHPFFETGELRVEFQAANAQRFRELADALHNAAQSPKLEELFHVV